MTWLTRSLTVLLATSKCKTEYVMSSCVTVVDQLLSGVTKRDNLDEPYWENLIKSVAAVVYEGEVPPLILPCAYRVHDLLSWSRYGTGTAMSITMCLLIDTRDSQ